MITRSMQVRNVRSTTIFVLAIVCAMALSYGLQKQIEIAQQNVEIDYN